LRGIEYSEKAFERAERTGEIELMAKTALDLCSSYVISGHYFKVTRVVPRVIVLLERSKKERESYGTEIDIYSTLQGYCWHSLGFMGKFEEANELFRRVIPFALELNNKSSLGHILFHYGVALVVSGDGESAADNLQNSAKYLEEVNFVWLLSLCWYFLGWAYCLLGNRETARRYIEKGLEIECDLGTTYLLSLPSLISGMLHFDSNDLQNARTSLREAVRFSKDNHNQQIESYSTIWLGRILAKEKNSYMAEKYFFRGIRILDELRIRPWCAQGYLFLGELYADTDQRERALEDLGKAQNMFQEMGMDYWLAKTQEVLERL
jgi:tetratricopeptide (TPR) repeat protein